MLNINISKCNKADFDQIINNFHFFWGNDNSERLKKLKILHHPMMIYELGDNAFVIKDEEIVAAYLFGIFSTTEPLAYVHLIASHNNYKRMGLASALYNHFINKAKNHGCKYLKAITSYTNITSMNFHKNIGMELLGEPNKDGITVVKNYAGPNEDRVVFIKEI
jgi:L-amino acid N-acyltransferase YncA